MSAPGLIAVAGGSLAVVAGMAIVQRRLLRGAWPPAFVLLVGVAAGLGVAAEGAPTGLTGLDAGLRALVAIAFVVAGSLSGARARLAASCIVAVPPLFVHGGGIPAFLALGASVAVVATGADGPTLGAAVGLALSQAALGLEWPKATGATTAIALAALAALAVPVILDSRAPIRRAVLVPMAVLGSVAALVVLAYLVLMLLARSDLNEGVDASRAAVAAARDGKAALAAREFERASAAFRRAHDRLDAWWARPVRVVPIAAQHARAVVTMSGEGARLTRVAARTVLKADPDAVKLTRGTVPLDELRSLEPPLVLAERSLGRAQRQLQDVDGTWLLAPLADRLRELDRLVDRAARAARTGVRAARILPSMLGGDGERRYFVAFQTPSESRANGGIIGSFAEISFTDGRLELVRSGRDRDLNMQGVAARTLVGPADYIRRYSQFEPENTWQNVTMSPDAPSVAQVIEGLYPQSGGGPIDGVISVDPIALAAFLELTGPVRIAGLTFPLTSENAAQFLLRDQYVAFASTQERVDFLGEAIRAVVDRLQSGDLPGPTRTSRVLGPMVAQGRLKLHSVRPREARFVERIGMSGALPAVRGDFVGLVTQNASGNKIDVFLHRSLRYDAVVDPGEHQVRAKVTITLRNDAPSDGLPLTVIGGLGPDPTEPGDSRLYVSLYTPLALRRATLDEEPLVMDSARELGRNVLSAVVLVRSRSSVTMTVSLAGTLRGSARRYRLDVWRQPTVEPDHVAVSLGGVPGTELTAGRGLRDRGGRIVGSGRLDATTTYRATAHGS